MSLLFFLVGIALWGLVFILFFAGRRKTTAGGPTSVAPGSKEAPVSGAVIDPKLHGS